MNMKTLLTATLLGKIKKAELNGLFFVEVYTFRFYEGELMAQHDANARQYAEHIIVVNWEMQLHENDNH